MPGSDDQLPPREGEPVTCETCVHFLHSPGKELVGLSETAFWCPAKGERRFCGRSIACPAYKACGACAEDAPRKHGTA